ncbi:MAG: squalene/phytoene synthase family protein [Thermoanaerobaculia bacterium]
MDDPRQSPLPEPALERVRGEHPTSESWRADAFAASRHSDLRDEISRPLEVHDPEAAEALCAEVCRNALGGLAAGLVLLTAGERRRAQAIAACAATLFDFADQTGLEGDKLAQLNRWEFELERALDGDPAGQPVFVQLARLHAEAPWPAEVLDGLVAAARRRVAAPRPPSEARLEAECRQLGRLALAALGVEAPTDGAIELTGLLVRTRRLLAFGEGLRRHRIMLPGDGAGEHSTPGTTESLESSARRAAVLEKAHLAARLEGASVLRRELPQRLRPAGRFVLDAARILLRRFDAEAPLPPPELRLWERLRLLLTSRRA